MFSTLTEKEVTALAEFRTEFALMFAAVTEDGDVLPTEDITAIVLEVTVCVLSTRRLSPLPALLSVVSKTPALLLSAMSGPSSDADLVQAFCGHVAEFTAQPSTYAKAA